MITVGHNCHAEYFLFSLIVTGFLITLETAFKENPREWATRTSMTKCGEFNKFKVCQGKTVSECASTVLLSIRVHLRCCCLLKNHRGISGKTRITFS